VIGQYIDTCDLPIDFATLPHTMAWVTMIHLVIRSAEDSNNKLLISVLALGVIRDAK
jgi:hypothetical protein